MYVKKTIIFYEYLDVWALMPIVLGLNKKAEVYYFEASSRAHSLINLLKLPIFCFEFNLEALRNAQGQSYYKKIFCQDLLDLCNTIRRSLHGKSRFIKQLGGIFATEKFLAYCEKRLSDRLEKLVTYLNVIQWFSCVKSGCAKGEIVFSVQKGSYFFQLSDFAREKFSIKCIAYHSCKSLSGMIYYVFEPLFRLLFQAMIGLGQAVFFKKEIHVKNAANSPFVAMSYSALGITFDPGKRFEFPWLLYAHIPRKQALVYVDFPNVSLSETDFHTLRKEGIAVVSLIESSKIDKSVPVFTNTFVYPRGLLCDLLHCLRACLLQIFSLNSKFLLYLDDIACFSMFYWRNFDFYSFYKVKVSIDKDFFCQAIPRQYSLESLGGVSVSYQISAWNLPESFMTSFADVKFFFGPFYYDVYRKTSSKNKHIVYAGYTTDYSFDSVFSQSEALRRKLRERGAKFIVTYLDENCDDSPKSFSSRKTYVMVYRKLLDWVIRDRELGLICSPKKPMTSFYNMSELQSLYLEAVQTGRCVVRTGQLRTMNYPIESSLASDITITLLMGLTVALESQLCGRRVVAFDHNCLHYFPEYAYDNGMFVFEDMDKLIYAINRYRDNDKNYLELGDASSLNCALIQKDPFQDKRSAERMSYYLGCLFESLARKYSGKKAIEDANRKYRVLWGAASVLDPAEKTSKLYICKSTT